MLSLATKNIFIPTEALMDIQRHSAVRSSRFTSSTLMAQFVDVSQRVYWALGNNQALLDASLSVYS